MNNLKRVWFIVCMLFVCSFGMTACVASAEAQEKIDVLLERQIKLSGELSKAYSDHAEGKLTTKQLGELKDSITKNVSETKAEVEKLKASGVGWGELAVSTLIGLASRGVPSKGPVAMLFSLFTARRKED